MLKLICLFLCKDISFYLITKIYFFKAHFSCTFLKCIIKIKDKKKLEFYFVQVWFSLFKFVFKS